MGRVRRRRTRDISSPTTDGFVSWLEYAQVDGELSRFQQRWLQRTVSGVGSVGLIVEGGGTVEDKTLLDQINELAAEEHELFQKESRGEATEEDVERLRHLEVTLDQSWDLLHQRRARRDAGLDPEDAKVRDERTVEGYVN